MTKYIDTWQGKIAVTESAGVKKDDVYVVNLDSVRQILQDPEYMRGCHQQWLVPDEDEFMEALKERFSEDSTSRGQVLPGFLGPRL